MYFANISANTEYRKMKHIPLYSQEPPLQLSLWYILVCKCFPDPQNSSEWFYQHFQNDFLKEAPRKEEKYSSGDLQKSSYLTPSWTNFNVSICVRIVRTWSTTLLKTPSQGYIVWMCLRNSFCKNNLQSIFFLTVPHRRKFLEIFPTSYMVDDLHKTHYF